MSLVSWGTRFEAFDWKATYLPSADIEGHPLVRLPFVPSARTLTWRVVPAWRSRTYTSNLPLVSRRTRLEPVKKATYRPPPEIDGNAAPRPAWLSLELTLTRWVLPVRRSCTNASDLL